MPTFIVESYGADRAVVDQRERAEQAGRLRTGIRYVRTTIVPGDETLLHLFEAVSAEALREAVAMAALGCDRIVEVVETRGPARRTRAGRPVSCRPRAGDGGPER